MASPANGTTTAPASTALVRGGRGSTALSPFTVTSDGIWTWFTRPEALQVGDALYVGAVTSDGRCRAHRIDLTTQAVLTFDLSGVLEVDDHNNTSFVLLPGGKIAAFYGQHNDPTFRYRVWDGSGAFDSSGSWGAEQARGTGSGPYSYPNPLRFTHDSPKVWLFQRRWLASGRGLCVRSATDLTTTAPHTWGTQTDLFSNSSRIPYWRIASDGVDKVHIAITNGHPVEGATSLYHFQGQLVAGAWQWSRSDGAAISSVPMAPSDATLVYDGTTTKCWVSDCAIGADGHPRILYMRYPGNNGSQIEYWHARWTGSAWTSAKITDDGAGLYSPEVYYHGGLAFDQQDASRIYLSAPISGVRQVQEWRTADDGATWAQHRAITSGGTAGSPLKARPIGVKGADGRVRVLWWEGTYTTFISYSTSVKAAG